MGLLYALICAPIIVVGVSGNSWIGWIVFLPQHNDQVQLHKI